MDAEAAIALFDQLEADGEPLDDLSVFDDLGSSDEDGLSSGEEELLDNNLLGLWSWRWRPERHGL